MASGLAQAATPTGGRAMYTTVFAPTLPAAPTWTAVTGASQNNAPAGAAASSSVTNRTPPALMHTVPAGTSVSVSLARST